MVFSEYVRSLQEFMEENKESANMTVVTASDDEGNAYSKVYFGPSLGMYNSNGFKPFDPEEDLEKDINAVLVN